MSKLILTDIDDTILDCATDLEKFGSAYLGRPVRTRIRDTHFVGPAFGVDELTSVEVCEVFWRTEAFADLPPEPDASIVLPRLHAAGYKFIAITHCANHPDVIHRRHLNLERAFGFAFEDVYCTFRSSKAEILRRFEPAIWVEDNLRNALAGAALGHRTILLDRLHNRSSSAGQFVQRVPNWHEIENSLVLAPA